MLPRLWQDACRFPATHVCKVPDLFLFVYFVLEERIFVAAAAAAAAPTGWLAEEDKQRLLPLPYWPFFLLFLLFNLLYFSLSSQKVGPPAEVWSGWIKAAGGTIRHRVPPLSNTSGPDSPRCL